MLADTDTLLPGAPGQPNGTYAAFLAVDAFPFSDFETNLQEKFNLFALPEVTDFGAVGKTLDRIRETLPAIRRIFAHPITRLEDTYTILPAEAVRAVKNRTVTHAATHSELWENITERGLKPRKLLTLNHTNTYTIYENIVFVHTIDRVLHFLNLNTRLLRDMLYTDRNLNFNLLERENHRSYFVAIGKLHVSYARDYEQFRPEAERLLGTLRFLGRTIRAWLGRPVYTACRRYADKVTLKKTGVFRLHKDYHRIYVLLSALSENRADAPEPVVPSADGYRAFCRLLSVFAAAHFNFHFDRDSLIDPTCLDASCRFGAWRLSLTEEAEGALLLTFRKDTTYRVLLLPHTDAQEGKTVCIRLRESIPADEYLLCTPFEEEKDSLFLSLFDIDSFRRLQQIFLRGMIYCDRGRDLCPFCGQPLVNTDSAGAEGGYICKACRTRILELTCPVTNTSFYATAIADFTPAPPGDEDEIRRDKLLYSRYIKAQMHFRNITPIAGNAQLVCPRCGQLHADCRADTAAPASL